MLVFGRLLVIWGFLTPVIALPAMNGYEARLGFMGNLLHMHWYFLGVPVSYAVLWALCLIFVGTGLSLCAGVPPTPPCARRWRPDV